MTLSFTTPCRLNRRTEKRRKLEAERAARARSTTLRQALDSYERALKKAGRSEQTIKDYRYLLTKYLAGWLDRELVTITKKEVARRHDDIPLEIARGKHNGGKKRGPEAGRLTSNQVMRAFRAVFNHGWDEDAHGPTPKLFARKSGRFVWFPEHRRTSRIPADGLKDWYDRVQALTNTVRRDCLLLTLFTGLRIGNAMEVRVEDIDFQHGVLHVPKPKSKQAFDLPLSTFLVDLLKARVEENKVLAPGSQWIFPARGEGHIVEVRLEGGEARAKSKADGRHYAPHDLRRTFKSVAVAVGVPPETCKVLMNHSTPKADISGGYYVPELEELRRHMEKISGQLLALCKPAAGGKVVPMMRKKSAKGTR